MRSSVSVALAFAANLGMVACNARLLLDHGENEQSPVDAGPDVAVVTPQNGGASGGGTTGGGGTAGTGSRGGAAGSGGTAGSGTGGIDSGTCSRRATTCDDVRPATLRVPLGLPPQEPDAGAHEMILVCVNDDCINADRAYLPEPGEKHSSTIYRGNSGIAVTIEFAPDAGGGVMTVVFEPKPFDEALRNGDDYVVKVGRPSEWTVVERHRARYRSFVDENGLSCIDVTLAEQTADAGPDPSPCSVPQPVTLRAPIPRDELEPGAVPWVDINYNDTNTNFVLSEFPRPNRTEPIFVGQTLPATVEVTTDRSGASFVTVKFYPEPFSPSLRNGDIYSLRVGSLLPQDGSFTRQPWTFMTRSSARYRSFVENVGPCGDPVSCIEVTLTEIGDAG